MSLKSETVLLILMHVVLSPENLSRMEQGRAAVCLARAPGAAQPRRGEDSGLGEMAVQCRAQANREGDGHAEPGLGACRALAQPRRPCLSDCSVQVQALVGGAETWLWSWW